ncbi:hypothetical protein B0H11DRAFT_2166591 [Mycena galericulata]|nr:hypothetical protein B0H11DRAFT_2166591 [Mycena galericulata]
MLYLTSDLFPISYPLPVVPFGVIGFLYLIRIAASFTYRLVPLPENPTYIAAEDVTIIVPTIDAGEEFKEAARSWLVGQLKEILIITEEKILKELQALAHHIIVFADDDAICLPTLLPYALARFEDQKVGGVGTSQRVQPAGNPMTIWEVLAAFCLTIRNIETSSSTHIDGALPCLSGCTAGAAVYRPIILKDPEFIHGFTHDFWVGKHQLNSLLIGPVFVSPLMAQSTVPVTDGGYHLPWCIVPWLFATGTAKLLPHLWHRPQDTGWGMRAGIGDATAATARQA